MFISSKKLCIEERAPTKYLTQYFQSYLAVEPFSPLRTIHALFSRTSEYFYSW